MPDNYTHDAEKAITDALNNFDYLDKHQINVQELVREEMTTPWFQVGTYRRNPLEFKTWSKSADKAAFKKFANYIKDSDFTSNQPYLTLSDLINNYGYDEKDKIEAADLSKTEKNRKLEDLKVYTQKLVKWALREPIKIIVFAREG